MDVESGHPYHTYVIWTGFVEDYHNNQLAAQFAAIHTQPTVDSGGICRPEKLLGRNRSDASGGHGLPKTLDRPDKNNEMRADPAATGGECWQIEKKEKPSEVQYSGLYFSFPEKDRQSNSGEISNCFLSPAVECNDK